MQITLILQFIYNDKYIITYLRNLFILSYYKILKENFL